MSATERMNDLAERKRSLVAEAALHRSLLALEGAQLREQYDAVRENIVGRRWWWIAGAVAAGWLTGRGDLARWLPAAMNVLQFFRRPPE